MVAFRPLILIPSYNTGCILFQTIVGILKFETPVWIILDGSTDDSKSILESIDNQQLRIIFIDKNGGKGAAIFCGLQQAIAHGFTHILTMDADGQHPAELIPSYLKLSASHPDAAIFGRPIFDTSAPALRVGGRKISNFWVNLETLGWGVDDSLFGMRLYPAVELEAILESTRFARRFDFDPEVAVRLAWRQVPILNLPTPVRYPSKEEGGVSQFRYLRDNFLLTSMHMRLMLEFFVRFPWLLFRGDNPLGFHNPPNP